MTKPILVYITTASENEAKSIALAVVEEKLAACANIIPSMQSIYRWEGNIEHASETVLLFKSQSHLFEQLEARVKALHSYETPCIIAFDISAGSKEYLEWLSKEVYS